MKDNEKQEVQKMVEFYMDPSVALKGKAEADFLKAKDETIERLQ